MDMETQIIKVHDIVNDEAVFLKAGEVIKKGGLVAFPTETVYGLGADGLDSTACAGIYKAKGRPSDNPLILHVSDRAMVDMVAEEVSPLAEKLIAAFCPGPITIIVKKKRCVPDSVTGGLDTVGVRMPDNDVARTLIKAAGRPIAAPSANISGRPSPTTAEAVYNDMKGRIPMILDGGPCQFGVESTIVEVTGNEVVILRPGAITPEMLNEVAERVSIDPAVMGDIGVPKAPGMKYRHYAPKAPLILIKADENIIGNIFYREIKKRKENGVSVGMILSDETMAALKGNSIYDEALMISYGPRMDKKAIAAKLYEALRFFDTKKIEVIFAEAVNEDGLGLAIMNRLKKAAGGQMIEAENGVKV